MTVYRLPYRPRDLTPYLPELVDEIIAVLLPVTRYIRGQPVLVCRDCGNYDNESHAPLCAVGRLVAAIQKLQERNLREL